MNHEEIRARLDEFADGTLPEGEERAAVARHLAECRECAGEVAELETVLAQVQGLARTCPPPRDLWPEVEVAIQARPRRATPIATAFGWRWIREHVAAVVSPWAWSWEWKTRVALAAASILVVVVASNLPRSMQDEPGAQARYPAAEVTPVVRALDLQCMGTGKQLLTALEGPPGALTPEAAAVIEENLKIVERAIEESRLALEVDPGNGQLVRMLAAHYQRKLLLLQDATRLATEDLT